MDNVEQVTADLIRPGNVIWAASPKSRGVARQWAVLQCIGNRDRTITLVLSAVESVLTHQSIRCDSGTTVLRITSEA